MTLAEPGNIRKAAYALLITVAVGAAVGRIVGMERVIEPSLFRPPKPAANDPRGPWPPDRPTPIPTHGDNDRSRWATVRALVDNGTYVIGHRDKGLVAPSAVSLLAAQDSLAALTLAAAGHRLRTTNDTGIIAQDGWRTIDKVLHPESGDFYSSKPPFLTTLVAGFYWLLNYLLNLRITVHTWVVVRTILLVVSAMPLLVYLVLLSRLAERFGASDWGRLFLVAAACFATLVTPFLTTLNNHTIATFTALFALYPTVQIWSALTEGKSPPSHLFLLAGFFAAFTACTELPAAAYAAALFGLLFLWAPGRTLCLFVPAAIVPVAAFFLTNYLAIGQWQPAYSEFGGPWYQFEGSHWSNPELKTGIDFARNVESRGMYAFHLLLGHHGLFSLTPIWLFALMGMVAGLFTRRGWLRVPARGAEAAVGLPAFLFPLTVSVSAIVVGFYLVKSDNYGGWTSGLRWLMWLTPLWLLAMLPVLDRLAAWRCGRGVGYVFLGISALTASFPAWNPWRQPWLYRLLSAWDLVPY
jgi:hypothetical protein